MAKPKGTNYENMPGEVRIRQEVQGVEDIDEPCAPGWMHDRGKVVGLTTKLREEHRRVYPEDGEHRN